MASIAHNYEAAADLLAGRVILITGAGDGIGRAVTLACAAHGATVVLLGRTVTKLEAVYDQIVAAGGERPAIQPLDLAGAGWDDYLRVAAAIESQYGRLDGLLHNAGILGDMSPIEHYDIEVWQRVLRVNLTAVFALTRACLPALKRSADASLLFTSSGVGRKGRAYWGAYSVSKFGVEALTDILADETEENTRVRVNSINPGKTRTNMRRAAYPFEDSSTLVRPENIVLPYLYLLGPDSRGITGQRFDCQA
ncbi:MAG: YciK family oxidoreductase [Gammaproteobacteria bacterium]|nr:YciK family oxidoreductase [Gammaproteobacteria bacterium]